jgi:hypothetical protein
LTKVEVRRALFRDKNIAALAPLLRADGHDFRPVIVFEPERGTSMDVDHAVQSTPANTTQAALGPHSPEWWHARTADELRAIIVGGFEMGEMFDAATAEADRRAALQRRADERAAEAEMVRKMGLRRRILETLLLACLVALIASVLVR